MRTVAAFMVFVVLLSASVVAAEKQSVEVYFSPDGGCTEAIVKAIGEAKTSIKIQAYSFTSKPIAQAILDAKKRGVAVEAVLDKSNKTDKYSAATFLDNEGVPVFIDEKHAIAHNKVILIDDNTIITGSFNFTNAAETKNAENLLIIRGYPDLFAKYVANFDAHKKHSVPYVRPKADPAASKAAQDG